MANPITPSGNRRYLNPVEEAQNQDRERRIREDNAYFERTGENRPPIPEYSPLVDNDRPNVAYDGDSYDDRFNRHTAFGDYAEDTPTRIIDPDAIIAEIGAMQGLNTRPIPRTEREAYIQRERIIEDKDFQVKAEETKNKFKSAIGGLQIDEE